MAQSPHIKKIYVGGWFQRTTLHLSEIYDFLNDAHSPLALDKEKLKALQAPLGITNLAMHAGELDYISIASAGSIEIKVFEDGLIVLSSNPEPSVKEVIASLTAYYEQKLSPALSYIFSLGAPIPKELANIKTIYPYFVVMDKASNEGIEGLLNDFGEKKYVEIKNDAFEIHRGDRLYIINNLTESLGRIEWFIHEQIFMREFKGQMHRYLNLHRNIWERIADVKEKGEIKGNNIGPFKERIESYAKTINLIDARINQMGTYIRTRETIVKNRAAFATFVPVLQYKYETLADTLAYIKEIWKMTANYVNAARDLFGSIQAQSTEYSVKNLTVVTSMGVGATLIGLLTGKPPEFSWVGVVYFASLAAIGYASNEVMKRIYTSRMYKIKDAEIAKDI